MGTFSQKNNHSSHALGENGATREVAIELNEQLLRRGEVLLAGGEIALPGGLVSPPASAQDHSATTDPPQATTAVPSAAISPTHGTAADQARKLLIVLQVLAIVSRFVAPVYKMLYLGVPKLYESTLEKLAITHQRSQALLPPPQGAFEKTVAKEVTDMDSWLRSHMMWMVQLVGVAGSFYQVISPPSNAVPYSFAIMTLVLGLFAPAVSTVYGYKFAAVKRDEQYVLWTEDLLALRHARFINASISLAFPMTLNVWAVVMFMGTIIANMWVGAKAAPPSLSFGGLPVGSSHPQATSHTILPVGLIVALMVTFVVIVLHGLLVCFTFYSLGVRASRDAERGGALVVCAANIAAAVTASTIAITSTDTRSAASSDAGQEETA